MDSMGKSRSQTGLHYLDSYLSVDISVLQQDSPLFKLKGVISSWMEKDDRNDE